MTGDLRRAVRSLARSPLFAAVAVLSMALVIGTNATVFAVVDALLLRPVPLDLDRLVSIREVRRTDPAIGRSATHATFDEWRTQTTGTMDAAAFQSALFRLADDEGTERHTGAAVSWNLFAVLGVRPAYGRGLVAGDDRPAAAPVALLSDALWQERYGRDSDVLGRSVAIDGVAHTIVGIMPRELSHPVLRRTLSGSQLWIPLETTRHHEDHVERRLTVYARLHDEVARGAADAQLDVIARALEATSPGEHVGWRAVVEDVPTGFSSTTRLMLVTAMGAVAFLLLIVCANLASLTLTRTVARRREIVTRLALGAPRLRVVRQLFSETIVLVVASLPLGVVVARVLSTLTLGGDGQISATVAGLNVRVLAFTAGITALVGVVSGLVPVLLAVRRRRALALAAGNRSNAAGGPEHSRLSGVLVVAEVALAITLLVGASLFARSFQAALEQDGTFDTSAILMASVADDANADVTAGSAATVDELLGRLESLPGVSAVAATSTIPLRTAGVRMPVVIDDDSRAGDDPPLVYVAGVTADVFRVLQVPMAQGRMFSSAEADAGAEVAVVNATLARRLWGDENPIGRRLRTTTGDGRWLTVVGVSGDVLSWNVGIRPVPTVHVPYARAPVAEPNFLVRSTSEPSALIRPVRDVVLALDPTRSVRVTTMTDVHHSALSRNRTLAWLFSIVGAVALGLAAFGVYGVLSYFVSERTHEIGVRAALGADRRALIGHFMKQAAMMLAVGAVLGVAGAWMLGHAVRGLLHGTVAMDPVGAASAIGALAIVGAGAAWLPARRAARVDPMVAMRE